MKAPKLTEEERASKREFSRERANARRWESRSKRLPIRLMDRIQEVASYSCAMVMAHMLNPVYRTTVEKWERFEDVCARRIEREIRREITDTEFNLRHEAITAYIREIMGWYATPLMHDSDIREWWGRMSIAEKVETEKVESEEPAEPEDGEG